MGFISIRQLNLNILLKEIGVKFQSGAPSVWNIFGLAFIIILLAIKQVVLPVIRRDIRELKSNGSNFV